MKGEEWRLGALSCLTAVGWLLFVRERRRVRKMLQKTQCTMKTSRCSDHVHSKSAASSPVQHKHDDAVSSTAGLQADLNLLHCYHSNTDDQDVSSIAKRTTTMYTDYGINESIVEEEEECSEELLLQSDVVEARAEEWLVKVPRLNL